MKIPININNGISEQNGVFFNEKKTHGRHTMLL